MGNVLKNEGKYPFMGTTDPDQTKNALPAKARRAFSLTQIMIELIHVVVKK